MKQYLSLSLFFLFGIGMGTQVLQPLRGNVFSFHPWEESAATLVDSLNGARLVQRSQHRSFSCTRASEADHCPAHVSAG